MSTVPEGQECEQQLCRGLRVELRCGVRGCYRAAGRSASVDRIGERVAAPAISLHLLGSDRKPCSLNSRIVQFLNTSLHAAGPSSGRLHRLLRSSHNRPGFEAGRAPARVGMVWGGLNVGTETTETRRAEGPSPGRRGWIYGGTTVMLHYIDDYQYDAASASGCDCTLSSRGRVCRRQRKGSPTRFVLLRRLQ